MGVPRTISPTASVSGVRNRPSASLKTRRSAVRGICICSKRLFFVYAICANQLLSALASTEKGGGSDIEVNLMVPRESQLGTSIELRCDWRVLGGSKLYTVKWYKDDHEFFRYVPDDDPTTQTFSQVGINLDMRSTTEHSIRLRELVLASSGQYKCEVSTEAPSFATTFRTSNLTVIALPKRPPEITGLSSHYTLGENITANCTAWPSVPKPTIRWSINDKHVPEEKMIEYPVRKGKEHDDTEYKVGLWIEVEPRYFDDVKGKMSIRIKCISKVGSKFFEDSKEIAMAYVKNQRLSSGDRRGTATDVRPGDGVCSSLLVLSLLILTT